MPRKEFEAFTRLDASDVNTYLMDQAVMVFANSAARGSAIASPTEGMVAYLNDSNLMTIYDGANWKTSLATTGSILQVVTANSNTEISSSSASAVSTGLTATITPSSTSNRIAIFTSFPTQNNGVSTSATYTLFRGTVAGTNLGTTNFASPGFAQLYSSTGSVRTSVSMHFIDTPNTTSATQYTVAFFGQSGAAVVMHEGRRGTLTLMEIAG
jgi:hypothetical protein